MKNIVQILLLALWVVIASSVLVLLVAAINIKSHKSCKGIDIEIRGVTKIFFLDKADILRILAEEGIVKPEGKAMTDFNLQKLETVLEKNVWVKDAELFFDNNLLLHINILEKEPVARIFTSGGGTFYIDSSGSRMPLNNKMNVKLPVFTSFPDGKTRSVSNDSILLNDIRKLTMYILNDKFWMAQIAQVDITPERNFEMIPTVGNHIIEFGNGANYESKFRRLFMFYKQVLGHTGIDTYSKISVQYDKQIIGTKKGTITKVDSVQALKNIQKMIEEAGKVSEDSMYAPTARNIAPRLLADSMIMDPGIDSEGQVQKKRLHNNDSLAKPASVNGRHITDHKPVVKRVAKPMEINTLSKTTATKPKPKAVMSKLNN